MKPDFDYNTVPYNYAHCFHSECKYAAKCLRHQVALRVPPEKGILSIVSPLFKPADGTDCPYFKADALKRFAQGMTHILDKVPHKEATALKRQMLSHFERNTFYRCWRGERLIHPDEQAYIRQLFINYGFTDEPVFDLYLEQYEW